MDAGGPPPPELRLAWLCKRWGGLPAAGGLLDQDYQMLYRMTALSNVTETLSDYRNLRGAEIHGLTEGQRRTLRFLRGMDLL